MVLGGLLLIGSGAAAAAPPPGTPPSHQQNPGEGVCDVDGVHASYDVEFRGDLDPASYRVAQVRIGELAPTCSGAQLTVRLLDDEGGELAEVGPIVTGTPVAFVPFPSAPPAGQVAAIDLVIAGGEVPVPPECQSMTFDQVLIGTTDDDSLRSDNGRVIAYGLEGDDRIDSGNQADCVDGGPGDDRVDGGNHHDVVLGGEGADRLFGSAGNDGLFGGDGDDHLDGGVGNDTCEGGPGTDTFTDSCEVQVQ